jgi:hypothetical protein
MGILQTLISLCGTFRGTCGLMRDRIEVQSLLGRHILAAEFSQEGHIECGSTYTVVSIRDVCCRS